MYICRNDKRKVLNVVHYHIHKCMNEGIVYLHAQLKFIDSDIPCMYAS